MSRKLAFTLVELLTVLIIISVMAGFVMSAILGSKKRAQITVEISAMRQISQAANIYQSDYDEVHPLSVPPLVNAEYIPASLVASPLDGTRQGLLIAFWNNVGMPEKWRKNTTYRVSYIGIGDSNMPFHDFQQNVVDKDGAGWLIAFSRASSDTTSGMALKIPGRGPYLRATLSGSVLHRNKSDTYGISWREWFFDN